MTTSALEWIGGVDGYLELIDQRRLPADLVGIECRGPGELFDAIKNLAVRGAPAIGVAAAFGLVLGLREGVEGLDIAGAIARLEATGRRLASCRPTAVNLAWAVERVLRRAMVYADGPAADVPGLRRAVLDEALAVRDEDVEMCRRIGVNGRGFIKAGSAILTHCNAGALATAGQGTALSVMFEAKKSGTDFTVFACETRPLLQGARLTAWELQRAEIPVTVICDGMAGWLMKLGKIDAVITGADRIAANGDVANKIGTYSLAVLAARHSVAFYVAAPSSTFDLGIESGRGIPIENRPAEEVMGMGSTRTAPEGVDALNPAFDVTDAVLITAIITEKGVIERPDAEKIRAAV
jgi:methylthioribose-1-phosphate isomerase